MLLRLRRIFWLGLKEGAGLRRDAVMLGLLIYSFTLAIMIEATGVSASVSNASIAFVDEDRSALTRRLAAAFMPPEFQPAELIAAREIDAAMDAGRFIFVVVAPPGFEADLRARRSPTLQLLIDATAMEQAGIGAAYVVGSLTEEIARFAEAFAAPPPAAGLVVHSAFNPDRDPVRFQGVIALIGQVTTMTIILTGAALMREREHGAVGHLLAMPLDPLDIALAKIWANAAIVLGTTAFSLLVVVEGLLGVEIAGSRLLFLGGAALYMFAVTALGVLLATLARSMAQFALLFILVVIPMQLLSGGGTPVESQPEWLRTLTLALPSRHFVDFAQAILFKGAGIATVWPAFAAITALGLALLAASLALFRRAAAASA